MSKYDLRGKVVLITGASGGIGSETSTALYARGAKLVLTDLSQDALDKLAADMDPERVLTRVLNVVDMAATQAVVADAVEKFGKIDVVFANAGITAGAVTLSTMDEETFERVVDIDLYGVWRTVKACLPQIIENQGYILVTASVYAFVNGLANAPYCMAKAGVEVFGRCLRSELAHTGAKAGVLFPGWTATPMVFNGLEGNPTAAAMTDRAFPGPFSPRRAVSPKVLAQAAVAGMETRRARVIAPKRWVPLSIFRGLLNMITDWNLDRDKGMHDLVRTLEDEARRKIRN